MSLWRGLLGVEKTVIERVEFDEDAELLVAHVRPTSRARGRCGVCQRPGPGYDAGQGRRRWRALDLGTVRAVLEADAPRVTCREHGVVVAGVPWARHDAGHTYAFDETVAWSATQSSKHTVTQLMRVAWLTVGSITWVWADVDASCDHLEGLRRIGIDEISYKKNQQRRRLGQSSSSGRQDSFECWCEVTPLPAGTPSETRIHTRPRKGGHTDDGPLELLVGVSFLVGVSTDVAGVAAAGLFVGFGIAMSINLIRGRSINCGCLGVSAETPGWPSHDRAVAGGIPGPGGDGVGPRRHRPGPAVPLQGSIGADRVAGARGIRHIDGAAGWQSSPADPESREIELPDSGARILYQIDRGASAALDTNSTPLAFALSPSGVVLASTIPEDLRSLAEFATHAHVEGGMAHSHSR